jgi:hypothetical protein
LLSGGATYNFVGVRVENSSTLVSTSNSNVKIMVNWIGGMWYDWAKESGSNYIAFLPDGGSFHSVGSIWMAKGSFYFGPRSISNTFEGDAFRVETAAQVLNQTPEAYFERVPKGVPLRLVNTRFGVF